MRTLIHIIISASLLVSLAFTFSSYQKNKNKFSKSDGIYDILRDLGEQKVKHEIDSITPELIQTGKELVTLGYSINSKGNKTKRISKHFVCTSCHNTEREDPDLSDALNPEKRLQYCKENKLPFLQGTTLWGIVNRESWYNDDYIQKYGDLVTKAQNDLAESTQLCAKECSQGRVLEDWELEAILAYYWSIQIKLSDLEIPDELSNKLNRELTEEEKKKVIIELKKLYSQRSSAHFIKGEAEQLAIKNLPEGDPQNGKLIYEISCKSCHKPNGVSLMTLNNSKTTKKKFTKHLGSYNHFDLYYITRDGTHPIEGHKAYMPYYPKERLSSKQLKDLVSYLNIKKK
jgi:mono/diheme cytochrome c family protein